MKGLWTISPSSAQLVQRCIDAAGGSAENNKWSAAFREAIPKRNSSRICQDFNEDNAPSTSGDLLTISLYDKGDKFSQDTSENHKIITEVVETDLIAKWPYVAEECSKNGSLFTSIAVNVSEDSLEKFCDHVFDTTVALPEVFVRDFLKHFLPAYLKKQQSRFSRNCIDRAHKCYPLEFKTVLVPCLLNNLEIPSSLISDYVQTLSANEKTDFLTNICDVKLTSEQFGHHLTALCTLYKDCEPTPCIQSYILSNLEEHCEKYSMDKNFGKLLLTFMQSCSVKHVNMKTLETIVQSHQSAFKTPCFRKFENGFKSKLNK